MKVRLEKIDIHKGVTVKALLDSGATGMFIDRKFVERYRFKLDKLEKPLVVTNVDSSNNSGGRITYKIECNVYYRGHQERMKFDVCNLGRTEVILGMPWLAAHNPEIDWEKGEVKMTRCSPWCGKDNRSKKAREKQEKGTRREARTVEGEKAISWAADEKKDWGREEEMEIDHQKIETMVPKWFHQWLKMFGKVESERMLVRKVWDHTVDVINHSFHQVFYHYSFTFLLLYFSIYRIGNSVTPCDIMRDRVTSRSRHRTCHTQFGWECRTISAQTK